MSQIIPKRNLAAAGVLAAGLLAWPASGAAETPQGEASAAEARTFGVFGTTAVLAGTGALTGDGDAREASALGGEIPTLLIGQVLHATAIGWSDQAASEASLSDLAISIAGTSIRADFVLGRALAVANDAGFGAASIENLSINGLAVTVTGEPNQEIPIPGGRLTINEQTMSPGSTVVNALHVWVDGVADVVVGSATAEVQ